MDFVYELATFPRHNHLVGAFVGSVFPLFVKQKVYFMHENCVLVFDGVKYSGEETLIDASEISGLEKFRDFIIDEYSFILPDFMLFQYNAFIQSRNTLKTAGIPDLVVEIWSDSNTEKERVFKRRLYGSSDLCEHWYLEQDSNIVDCWIGKKKLSEQTLLKPLESQTGLRFYLEHLAI